MNIKELRSAYEAATPGEWVQGHCEAPNMAAVGTGEGGWLGLAQMFGDTDAEANANARFIALAHAMMPVLLEAVETLQELAAFTSCRIGDRLPIKESQPVFSKVRDVLVKLEGNRP